MISEVKELYEVAKSFVSGDEECSIKQLDDAFLVIELVEDGAYEEAFKVGMIY
jgi:hypothetical protein